MTERERILSIAVGGLLVATVIWWGLGKYNKAVETRENQIAQLQKDQQRLTEQRLQGEYANRQMGEYMIRSLPGDTERAQSQYQQWLLDMVQDNNLSNALVDANSSRTIGGLYQLLDFRVRGDSDVPSLIRLLHAFYAKDYLHRIRDMSIRRTRSDGFQVEMSIDAIALLAAPLDLPERSEASWKVSGDVADYLEPIMNRNLYEPPNQAPKYDGRFELEVFAGRENPAPLSFQDPEGHSIRYEIVDAPKEFVSLDERSGTLRIRSDDTREFDVVVRAIDSGFPKKTSEERLTVKVVDPPEPEPEPPARPVFDDATQTVLTALVQGRDEWTAWMHVRTRDETLRLRVGDAFEIGSLKGSVVEVTPRYVMMEIGGKKFELRPSGNLSEAAKTAQPTQASETAEPTEVSETVESSEESESTESGEATETAEAIEAQ